MQENSVARYMTRSPIVIYENASVHGAWDLLKNETFTHLPVLNSKEELTGILSLTDLENLTLLLQKSNKNIIPLIEDMEVRDIMTLHVQSIDINKSIEEANDMLLSGGIHALPVLENGKIAGIISETDILHYYNEKYKR
ncbi:MAG: CBS domain-containing protein [Spirochaetia bacterium]|nr:CBS domain-containing protein [Spirochaetia bacterium]